MFVLTFLLKIAHPPISFYNHKVDSEIKIFHIFLEHILKQSPYLNISQHSSNGFKHLHPCIPTLPLRRSSFPAWSRRLGPAHHHTSAACSVREPAHQSDAHQLQLEKNQHRRLLTEE